MCSKMLGPTQATKALTPAEIYVSGTNLNKFQHKKVPHPP